MPRDVAGSSQVTRRSRLVRLWRLWRQRARDRREAEVLDERELRDMGMTRGDLYREFTRRLWSW